MSAAPDTLTDQEDTTHEHKCGESVERPPDVWPPQEASTSGQINQLPKTMSSIIDSLRRYTWTEMIEMGGGAAIKEQLDLLQARLRQGAVMFQPTICKSRSVTIRELEYLQELGLGVPDWGLLKSSRNKPGNFASTTATTRGANRSRTGHQAASGRVGTTMKLLRAVKAKANGTGRTYTSKYRGVHQTFPTKRWEAQFRRNGKPTSLGCFDNEEEAARAYDKMMLWCELHNAAGVKSGITNFDPTEYEKDFAWLQSISQDELIENLRSEGRRQAAHRAMRLKREGFTDATTDDPEDPTHGSVPPPGLQSTHQPQAPQQEQVQMETDSSAAGTASGTLPQPGLSAMNIACPAIFLQQQHLQGIIGTTAVAVELLGLSSAGDRPGDAERGMLSSRPSSSTGAASGEDDDAVAEGGMLASDEYLMEA